MSDKCDACGKQWTHHAGIASTCAVANAWKVRAIAAENALLAAAYMTVDLARQRFAAIESAARIPEPSSSRAPKATKKRKARR